MAVLEMLGPGSQLLQPVLELAFDKGRAAHSGVTAMVILDLCDIGYGLSLSESPLSTVFTTERTDDDTN